MVVAGNGGEGADDAGSPPPRPDRSRLQRRTLVVLSVAQVLGGIGLAGAITAGSLLIADVTGSDAAGGAAQSAIVLGGAAAAVPMARLSARRGRRVGLSLGYAAGACGAVLAVLGGGVGSVYPLLLGLVLFGGAVAAGLQGRFAAADLASPKHVSRDLSVVFWMTAVGAILGPNLAEPAGATARSLGLPSLTGIFLWAVVAFVAATVVLSVLLRPDPLLTAQQDAPRPGGAPQGGPGSSSAQAAGESVTMRDAWHEVTGSRNATLALVAMVSVHTSMVGLMVMTPIQIGNHGGGLTIVGLVISVHVAGMYAFSPLVGVLADRVGQVPVILLGCVLMVTAGVVAAVVPDGSHGLVGVALLLLGLGWSFGVVAGSSLLTASVPERVRPAVQGLSDLAMGFCAATVGLLAGLVFGLASYSALGLLMAAVVLPALVLGVRTGGGAAERDGRGGDQIGTDRPLESPSEGQPVPGGDDQGAATDLEGRGGDRGEQR